MKTVPGVPGTLRGAPQRAERLLSGAPSPKIPHKTAGPRTVNAPLDEVTATFAGALTQMLQASPVTPRSTARSASPDSTTQVVSPAPSPQHLVPLDATQQMLNNDEKDTTAKSLPLTGVAPPTSAAIQTVTNTQHPQPADFTAAARDAGLRADATTTVWVGLHHARIVLGHAGETGSVEVRLKVNAGNLHIEARGDAAPMLLLRSGELAVMAASHGLQLGGVCMGKSSTGGSVSSGLDTRQSNRGTSPTRPTSTTRTRDGAGPGVGSGALRGYA